MKSVVVPIAVVAALLLASPSPATDARIDPLLRGPEFRPSADLPGFPRVVEGEPLAALLRVEEGLDDAARRGLEAAGLRFRRKPSGAFVQVGATWVVDGTPAVLRRLVDEGWGLQVARPLDQALPPTGVTGAEIEADALMAAGATSSDGFTGAGITVMDIDSGIDPFHPHLFRADGGAWPWVDVDDDGEFDPRKDGVDVNGDGEISEDEELRLMDAWRWEYDLDTWSAVIVGQDDELDPAADFLWLDANGNGDRDYGADAGFDEDDPAYGEWIFVPDDVDSDGVLDPDERLLLLGSSRIKVAWTASLLEFRRGENLVEFPVDIDNAGHGTGVVGIITGGRPHPLSTYPGLLPDVDILLYSYYGGDEADFVGALDRAEDEDVDVVLFELASWVGHYLDGSEYVERTIDDLMDDGVVQVCPAGNLAGNGKHTSQIEQDGRLSFPFTVPEGDAYTTYWYLNLELHVAPYSFVVDECVMTTPGGDQHEVLFDGEGPEILPGLRLYSQSRESSRDSDHYQIFAFSQAGNVELPHGQWSLDCAHEDDAQRPVHAFVSDNATGWSRGIVLANEQDASTLCWPSTADTCISVGASAGRIHSYDTETTPGQLHGYSSRGPRITGEKTIDVVAPADAYTASPTGGTPWLSREPAEYGMFSGTSGAGPHVAALAAQLVQAEPDLDGHEIRALLQQGALVDDQVDVDPDALPDDDWGFGKVRGHRALYGENGATAPARPVEVTVDFESEPGDDGRCRVTAIPSAMDHPEATFRWDWAYDGRFEGDFEAGTITYQIDPGSDLAVRVQAASAGWWLGGGLGLWSVPDDCRSGDACSGCGQGCSAGLGAGDVPRNLGAAMLLVGVGLLRRRRR